MRKLIIALLILGLLPVVAFAQGFPYPGTEVDSYRYDTLQTPPAWIFMSGPGNPNREALARCFASNKQNGACNKDFLIPFKVHASIAQWVEWDFTGTRWDWFVRKPGNYAANCLTWWISSNQEVVVDFHGFGPLLPESLKYEGQPPIEIWYTFDPPVPLPPKGDQRWIYATALNDSLHWFHIPDSREFHEGKFFKFWNYIHVVRCNSACEYQNDGIISLTLQCQKPWIDRTDGYFKPQG